MGLGIIAVGKGTNSMGSWNTNFPITAYATKFWGGIIDIKGAPRGGGGVCVCVCVGGLFYEGVSIMRIVFLYSSSIMEDS